MARAQEVMTKLRLTGSADTRIGGPEARGVSGGERKRVSIAIELLNRPQILFLDEPSSGLDSNSAANVVGMCREIAEEGSSVLMTIHQPSTEILNKFHKIILLAKGEVVWFGSVQGALDHFASLKHPCPLYTNPADHFIGIMSPDEDGSLSRAEDLITAYRKQLPSTTTCPLPDPATVRSKEPSHSWGISYPAELALLSRRAWLDVIRDPRLIIGGAIRTLILILLMGLAFWNLKLDQNSVQNRLGFLFFLCTNQGFNFALPVATQLPQHATILKRERAALSYRSSTFFLGILLAELPLPFVWTVLFNAIAYWMVNLQRTVVNFFVFQAVNLAIVWACIGLGMTVGAAAPTAKVAQLMAPLSVVIFVVFSGFLVSSDDLLPVFIWIPYLSPLYYGFRALMQNEFTGLTFSCPPDLAATGRCLQNGDQVLANFGVQKPSVWLCCVALICLGVGFNLVAYVLLRLTGKMKLRLI
ncbi:hypothetical protein HK097_002587 [Rhizophlyctis rosea]|uniref:ABC transporter domain-containing protein n=1 Tax=Rhizophlyctis rosea TaxID=64517 RepID=A0AAD5S3D7_9FUNG|nr:hypothetical protein HK097_002587 [Rhizophlyctis rosea]